jgi:hypothetical protein
VYASQPAYRVVAKFLYIDGQEWFEARRTGALHFVLCLIAPVFSA